MSHALLALCRHPYSSFSLQYPLKQAPRCAFLLEAQDSLPAHLTHFSFILSQSVMWWVVDFKPPSEANSSCNLWSFLQTLGVILLCCSLSLLACVHMEPKDSRALQCAVCCDAHCLVLDGWWAAATGYCRTTWAGTCPELFLLGYMAFVASLLTTGSFQTCFLTFPLYLLALFCPGNLCFFIKAL